MEKAREMILSSWLLLDSLYLHLYAPASWGGSQRPVLRPSSPSRLSKGTNYWNIKGKWTSWVYCHLSLSFWLLRSHCNYIHLEADNLKDEAHHQGAWACCGSRPPPSRKGRTRRWHTRSVPDRRKIGPRYLKFQSISLGLGEIWSKGAVNNIFKTISSLFPYSPFFFFLCVNRTLQVNAQLHSHIIAL